MDVANQMQQENKNGDVEKTPFNLKSSEITPQELITEHLINHSMEPRRRQLQNTTTELFNKSRSRSTSSNDIVNGRILDAVNLFLIVLNFSFCKF